jgi:hypothetical protein
VHGLSILQCSNYLFRCALRTIAPGAAFVSRQ